MYADLIMPSMVSLAMQPGRIVIATARPHRGARAIAEDIAARLEARRFAVDVADVPCHLTADCDAVVIGCAAGDEADANVLARYVESARHELSRVASALFLVTTRRTRDAVDEISRLVARLEWRPDLAAALHDDGGATGAMVRWILRHTSRRPDFSVACDSDVERFAEALGTGLARAAVIGELARMRSSRCERG
jgi:menaquinone-dependent protoporphyrinogen IX oxidase